jgi:MoaA/NifB/PqqE/SkfB family radical SAM enzyme
MITTHREATNDNYTFRGRLCAEFPSQIIMDITEICNLACIHCPHPGFSRSEHYAGRHLDPALNEKMIDEVRTHGQGKTRYIRYTSNGEPLVHPHAYEMIQSAVERSGVYVTLTTNGKILDERRTRRLLESGVHMIDVSIDAYREETYARIRLKGDLKVTRDNVLRLIRWRNEANSATRIVVSFIEQPLNAHEIDDFTRYWENSGADRVVIRRQHSHSGAIKELAVSTLDALAGLPRRPCLYPWERILINAKGELAFCPSDWVHGSRIADYRETTIHSQWQSEFYRQLRKAHIDNNFLQHPFCGQCPDWAQTRWPNEGLSYADMVDEFIQRNGESSE